MATAPGRSLRVIVVDDNVDVANALLGDLLELLGHQVTLAYDGPGGSHGRSHSVPEPVLLDIGLPGMDGYEVAARFAAPGTIVPRWWRSRATGRTITCCALNEAGFDRYIVKPVDIGMLEEIATRAARTSGG